MSYNIKDEFEKTTYERACEGYYESKTPYPRWPSKPDLLHKRAFDMTDEELSSASILKKQYEKLVDDYKSKVKEIQNERELYKLKLKSDLEFEFGISSDNPKADMLFNIAWKLGHFSAGYAEVVNHYQDLVSLIK